jgi:GNAT superfamily N-acetyltransferase
MIRKATRADYSRISEIRLAVRENRLSKPDSIGPLVDWLFDNSTFWVWEEDGTIQGFSAGDPRDGSICALFVHPSHERRGIGRALPDPVILWHSPAFLRVNQSITAVWGFNFFLSAVISVYRGVSGNPSLAWKYAWVLLSILAAFFTVYFPGWYHRQALGTVPQSPPSDGA